MRAIRRSGGKPPFPTSSMLVLLSPIKLSGPEANGLDAIDLDLGPNLGTLNPDHIT